MGISAILRAKGADVVSVSPDSPVQDVITLLNERGIGSVLVLDHESVVGLVSERDIVQLLPKVDAHIGSVTVRDVMKPVFSISPDDSIVHVLSLMTDRRIRHMPVMEQGRLVGIVSIGDLVKKRIEEIEREATALKDYIATT